MKKTNKLLSIALLAMFSLSAHGQVITTIANVDTTAGYNGDGIAASSAHLFTPAGIAVDHAGNIYVSDADNYRIRKIATDGMISTVAGNGIQGYSGNDGPATAAEIHTPLGLTTDNAGNIYFCDNYNNCVRKVSTDGIITRFAGDTGMAMRGYGADGIPATASKFGQTNYIVADNSGNVYISDYLFGTADSSRIRKVDPSGIVTTFAGGGTSSADGIAATAAILNVPSGLAIDGLGNVYVSCNNTVRRIDASGIITTVAGPGPASVPFYFTGDGGPATAASINGGFGSPDAIATDADGNLYIGDQGHFRIRKVNSYGIISTVAGVGLDGYSGDGGYATYARIGTPLGLAFDRSGNLLMTDYDNNCIRSVTYAVFVPENEHPALGINLFPNPSRGIFTMTIGSNSNTQARITIMDMAGQQVKDFAAATNKPVDVSLDVSTGLYLVVASTAEGKWSRQVVIE